MNTKTMRLPPRRVLTASSKKRELEVDAIQLLPSNTKKQKPAHSQLVGAAASSSHLLAGYLAHEFLTKGTLFGQPWEAARAETAVDLAPKPAEEEKKLQAEPREGAEPRLEKFRRYVALADLIRGDGAHLPGIVNPTQLARFLQL
ncbi:uncharacterized protein LOC133784809 [Humulus lupulus]|uniref:uncharacterized protein LOC133784809 n=1 Tax=Humulus lupulus TaxID=3486 RepID=UPI002B41659D|nr:uncharacterized protein LOC133784809 [Humulus lupulus]XP_062080073.1 uncharacterized protein LOC133784809 [Humulus lupulus]